MNVNLHAAITAHLPNPCWLPQGSGGHVPSCPETLKGGYWWQCDWRRVLTHTCIHTHSQPTQIRTQAGDLLRFVVSFFSLRAQQCIAVCAVWLMHGYGWRIRAYSKPPCSSTTINSTVIYLKWSPVLVILSLIKIHKAPRYISSSWCIF